MSEEVATTWDVPAIDGGDGSGYMTAGRLQALQDEAYQEAWQKGLEEGKAAGMAEIHKRAEQFDCLLNSLAQPFEELDETVEQQVVDLAMSVARQLFRREMRLDPSHVIGVVREAIQLLPVASRYVQVHLNPEDAVLVTESLTLAENKPGWTIVEDPLISRGGCSVTTESSQVDATAEARLKAVIAAIAGDERQP